MDSNIKSSVKLNNEEFGCSVWLVANTLYTIEQFIKSQKGIPNWSAHAINISIKHEFGVNLFNGELPRINFFGNFSLYHAQLEYYVNDKVHYENFEIAEIRI